MHPYDLSAACLTDDHHRCTGKTNPEYIGGVAKCACGCHTERENGSGR